MKKALLHYLQGVKARAPQLVWLLIAMLAILTLNNLVIRGLLSRSATYLSRENLPYYGTPSGWLRYSTSSPL